MCKKEIKRNNLIFLCVLQNMCENVWVIGLCVFSFFVCVYVKKLRGYSRGGKEEGGKK